MTYLYTYISVKEMLGAAMAEDAVHLNSPDRDEKNNAKSRSNETHMPKFCEE